MIAPDQEALNQVRARTASVLTPAQLERVRFVLPEQVFASVSAWEAGASPSGEGTSGESKELLTAKDVEELLRIDVKTIYGYVQKGLIPYVRIQSNLRFLKSKSWPGSPNIARGGGRVANSLVSVLAKLQRA